VAEESDPFEQSPDGLLFVLRDHVGAVVRWNSLAQGWR
jgi:hypothetical protein